MAVPVGSIWGLLRFRADRMDKPNRSLRVEKVVRERLKKKAGGNVYLIAIVVIIMAVVLLWLLMSYVIQPAVHQYRYCDDADSDEYIEVIDTGSGYQVKYKRLLDGQLETGTSSTKTGVKSLLDSYLSQGSISQHQYDCGIHQWEELT